MNSTASQTWDPTRYQTNASFVAQLGTPLIGLADLKPGERVLDLGCGDGALTVQLLEEGCSVVGVDASVEQIEAAQARGLDARVVSGEALEFSEEFDVVLSNAALHWMKNQAAAVDGIWRALKPGGRVVAEMGGGANVSRIARALETALDNHGYDGKAANPWYFPTPGEQCMLLEKQGFLVRAVTLFDRPTPLPGDIEGWLWTFGEAFLKTARPEDRDSVIQEVRAALEPMLRNSDGSWYADYVRLRFQAEKPE